MTRSGMNFTLLLTLDALLDLRDLEAARHQILEDTRRIVLHRCCLHLCYVLCTIACERVLRPVCVVQVQVRNVSFNAPGIGTDLVDEFRAGRLEELVLIGTLPVDIWLIDYGQVSAWSFSISTC
jgi:hypothetical protein